MAKESKLRQSSTYNSQGAELAVDNDDRTCAVTRPDNTSWWQSAMSITAHVHTIVLKTGVAFGCKILKKCLPVGYALHKKFTVIFLILYLNHTSGHLCPCMLYEMMAPHDLNVVHGRMAFG